MANLTVNADDIRRSVLTMLYRAKASHLGSNMSVIEMLIAIYSSVDCEKIRVAAPDRARVVISKGHCAAAAYSVLAHFGVLPLGELDTYHLDGSLLAGHVNHCVKGVEHSSGALGHGVNVAVGCALGLRTRGYPRVPAFAIVGDGELQEGSVWEALMFASHMKLSNLIVLVDNNRISSITRTEKVIDLHPLRVRFEGFGLRTLEVDGHSVEELIDAISDLRGGGKPGVIVCNTVKGKGVTFAEWQPIWHYKSLTREQYLEAMTNLNNLRISV